MFVLSLKTTRPRLAAFGVVLVLLFAVTAGTKVLSPGVRVPAGAGEATDPVAVLQGLGYEVESQWIHLREITLPADVDATFSAYNALQKEAGYDLTPYQGERVKCYTYTVLNYPGEERVEAHVYTHRNRVVAGDIASTAADGFCHGLTPLTPTTTVAQGEKDGTTG